MSRWCGIEHWITLLCLYVGCSHPGGEEKAESLAQSYTSLGNLYSDMGSQAEGREAQDQYLSQATTPHICT